MNDLNIAYGLYNNSILLSVVYFILVVCSIYSLGYFSKIFLFRINIYNSKNIKEDYYSNFFIGISILLFLSDFNALNGIQFSFGNIYVQAKMWFGNGFFQHLFYQQSGIVGSCGKIGFNAQVEQAKPDTRNRLNRGFQCCRHGTGINYVDGVIGAMVNTTQTDIGFAVEYFINCQLNTLYGGAAATIRFYIFEQVHFM